MRTEFSFEHLHNPARLGDPMHFHCYGLDRNGMEFRIALRERYSTDAAGIATSLGLQASANVELVTIVKRLEAKISDKTLMAL